MADFVNDNITLAVKTDLDPIAGSANQNQYVAATDWNDAIKPALQDLRTASRAARQLAFTPQAARPAVQTLGSDKYFWVRLSNNHPIFFNGTVDIDLTDLAFTVPFSAAPAFDRANGNVQTITLTGNIPTWTVPAGLSGQLLTIQWIQDGVGSRTIGGAPSNVKLAGSGFSLTTLANKRDTLSLAYDGANWIETGRTLNLTS